MPRHNTWVSPLELLISYFRIDEPVILFGTPWFAVTIGLPADECVDTSSHRSTYLAYICTRERVSILVNIEKAWTAWYAFGGPFAYRQRLVQIRFLSRLQDAESQTNVSCGTLPFLLPVSSS